MGEQGALLHIQIEPAKGWAQQFCRDRHAEAGSEEQGPERRPEQQRVGLKKQGVKSFVYFEKAPSCLRDLPDISNMGT